MACRLHDQLGLPIVGVPKTIDNDIVGTDVTFGFHTAVQIATDAIDRLHTTAESHDRVMVVEVMGRHAGWIATYAGIAGGATVDPDPGAARSTSTRSARILRHRHERGRYASIVVVAEGAEPAEGTLERRRAAARPYGHVQLGGIAHAHRPGDRGAHRVRDPGRRCSATCSAAARRPPTTACCRPATAWPPSTPSTTRRGARWSCYREMRIERAPLRLALGRTRTLDLAIYHDVATSSSASQVRRQRPDAVGAGRRRRWSPRRRPRPALGWAGSRVGTTGFERREHGPGQRAVLQRAVAARPASASPSTSSSTCDAPGRRWR